LSDRRIKTVITPGPLLTMRTPNNNKLIAAKCFTIRAPDHPRCGTRFIITLQESAQILLLQLPRSQILNEMRNKLGTSARLVYTVRITRLSHRQRFSTTSANHSSTRQPDRRRITDVFLFMPYQQARRNHCSSKIRYFAGDVPRTSCKHSPHLTDRLTKCCKYLVFRNQCLVASAPEVTSIDVEKITQLRERPNRAGAPSPKCARGMVGNSVHESKPSYIGPCPTLPAGAPEVHQPPFFNSSTKQRFFDGNNDLTKC
jgi:hypothetical protein